MIRSLAAFLALASAGVGGLDPHGFKCTPAPAPVRPAYVITIPEDWPWYFNALPGDRLDVLLIPELLAEGSPQERCANMGGTYYWDPDRGLEICEGVDF